MPETSGRNPATPDWLNALGKASSVSSYTPTMRQRAVNWFNTNLFGDTREGQDKAERLTNVVENLVPPVAAADMVYSGARQTAQGDYVGGPLTLAMAGIPAASKAFSFVRPAAMDAWHVSPHNWDLPRWDATVRGTGEGAQAFGDGFYAAESPRVSGLGGKYWQQFWEKMRPGPDKTAAKAMFDSNFRRPVAIDRLQTLSEAPQHMQWRQLNPDDARDVRLGLERLQDPNRLIPPYTYQLKLNMTPDNLLQWDKPMVKQPKPVKDFARTMGYADQNTTTEEEFLKTFREHFDAYNQHIRPKQDLSEKFTQDEINLINKDPIKYMWSADSTQDPGFWAAWTAAQTKHKLPHNPTQYGEWVGDLTTGADFYNDMVRLQSLPGFQKIAQDHNVHGTMFEDGISRYKTDGTPKTHNFAIWTPELIAVMKKLGIALPAAGVAGAAGMIDPKQKETQ